MSALRRIVTTEPTLLFRGYVGEEAWITNVGPVPIWIGDAQVEPNLGHRLLTGQTVTIPTEADCWASTVDADINRTPEVTGPFLVPWESTVSLYTARRPDE